MDKDRVLVGEPLTERQKGMLDAAIVRAAEARARAQQAQERVVELITILVPEDEVADGEQVRYDADSGVFYLAEEGPGHDS